MKKHLTAPQLIIFSSALLLIFFAFPYQAQIMEMGQENSWQFMMNFAIERGWKFGKDLFFPYGPLNFLTFPYNIGNQLLWSIVILTCLYVLYGYLVIRLAREMTQNTANAFLIVAACVLIEPHLITAEIFINQIQMLLIYFMWRKQNIKYAVIYSVLTILLFHTKYLEYYAAMAMGLSFIILGIIYKFNRTLILIVALGQTAAVLSYFAYNPSIYDFGQYLLGMYYISKGQCIDHTYSFESNWEWTVVLVPVFLVFWTGFLVWLYRCRRDYLPVYLILSTVMFFYYREGFVRHGGYHCFLGMAMFLASVALTLNLNTVEKIRNFLICAIGMALIPASFSYFTQGVRNNYDENSTFTEVKTLETHLFPIQTEPNLIHDESNYRDLGLRRIIRKMEKQNFHQPNRVLELLDTVSEYKRAFNDRCERCAVLSEEAKAIIQDSTFTTYPSELTYAYHHKNFRIMPGLQAHNAYHPFLEEKNYDFLMGKDAPEYLIYNPNFTDNRIPVIESPLTIQAIKLNYELVTEIYTQSQIDIEHGHIFKQTLLKKKSRPEGRIPERTPYMTVEVKAGVPFEVPKDAEYMSFEYSFNLKGHLQTLFWKIPEVKLDVQTGSKEYIKYGENIVIDNLINPFELYDLVNASLPHQAMFTRGQVEKLTVTGKGADSLKDMRVHFFKGMTY